MKIGFKINMGTGDLFIIKYVLDQVKHRFEKIYMIPNLELIKIYRNDTPEYYQYINDLMKLFFGESPYIIVKELNEPIMVYTVDHGGVIATLYDLGLISTIESSMINYNNRKCFAQEKNILDFKNYIVISTKVRGVYKQKYDDNKVDFYNTINLLSNRYKIVLIGEQRIDANLEYSQEILKDTIFCLYEDFKKYVNSFVDLTVSELANSPNIINLKKDCAIIMDAEAHICLGDGGNFYIGSSLCKKSISFMYPCLQYLEHLSIQNDYIKMFDNYNDFKNEILTLNTL